MSDMVLAQILGAIGYQGDAERVEQQLLHRAALVVSERLMQSLNDEQRAWVIGQLDQLDLQSPDQTGVQALDRLRQFISPDYIQPLFAQAYHEQLWKLLDVVYPELTEEQKSALQRIADTSSVGFGL